MEGRECLIFLENSWPPRILFPRNAYTFNFKEDRSILEARWRSRNRFIASNNNTASMLRRAFSMFDSTKSGRIEKEKVRTILNTLGHTFDDHELEVLLKQEDEEGSGKLNFDSFYRVACHFQEEDDEALQKELKEAFRLYDKEGNGYIPTSSLREILAALDDQITPDQMDGMIAEIDTDGSGTVDFDEFMEMMTGD
ncbi:troponin C type IIb isoform X1 [Apis mellifera carnica]|uniref:Troponin C type IIb isoform X1 n=1 Tax=Apis mellifera TaxID=7460 RepID=A0A7M7MSK9_APIME|nr:troponin C type IIb isoform X1 [Apis mellifera]KAG9428841.1 troponin C type IIb isoform X1 [Apis mellifera carnica]|eukprot:XP_026300344.1 troponin C type IIb isoform X1 [Apis mellifera]